MRKALDPAPADALAVVFPPDPSFVHPFAVARASGTLDLRADHSEASGKQSLHLDTNSLEAHISCSFCSLQAQPSKELQTPGMQQFKLRQSHQLHAANIQS